MTLESQIQPIQTVRPQVTADLMARTGLNEVILARLAHVFYDQVRADAMLGPIFAERVVDWGSHLDRMVEFWSSVALMTGRYRGAPIPKHLPLPVDQTHFDRWLMLFRQTAEEVCPREGAAWVIERAERIAFSIHANIQDSRNCYGHGDVPPQL